MQRYSIKFGIPFQAYVNIITLNQQSADSERFFFIKLRNVVEGILISIAEDKPTTEGLVRVF